MGMKEYFQEPVGESNYLQDWDEADEALSLCDLPLYGDYAADWDDSSTSEDQSSSSDDQDLFEFSSLEYLRREPLPSKNIIFCGKLITYKEPPSNETHMAQTDKNHQQSPLRWKSESESKQPGSKDKRDKSRTKKYVDKYDVSVEGVSILSSLTKSRRHLLLFGSMKLPSEMELSDIKSRQNRRHRSPPAPLIRSFQGREEVVPRGRSRGKGLWGLLKALSCRSLHANAVKAAFGCFSHV